MVNEKDFCVEEMIKEFPLITYEYSMFATNDGEIATGVSVGERMDEAVKWLKDVFMTTLFGALEENPNRLISFVLVTKERVPSSEEA